MTCSLVFIIGCLPTAWGQSPSPQALGIVALLEAEQISPAVSEFEGFERLNFKLAGVACSLACPQKAAEGTPWVWRARFWGHEPQFDRAMLKLGWHVAYCDVADLFGNDKALARWDEFYALSQKLSLHPRPFLEGMSRGGLIVGRWATAHPHQVCGIYLDNAVMDIRSWPGGLGIGKGAPGAWQTCLRAYGLSESTAADFQDGPLDRLESLAQAQIPVFVLINEADDVVPPSENGELLVSRLEALGGRITVLRRPNLGHHPHSLKNPDPLAKFALLAFQAAKGK